MSGQTAIYLITCLFLDESKKRYVARARAQGWYPTLYMARAAVAQNCGDLFELGYYNHAVIERVVQGINVSVTTEHWYRAEYTLVDGAITPDNSKPAVSKIEKPTRLVGSRNFGVG